MGSGVGAKWPSARVGLGLVPFPRSRSFAFFPPFSIHPRLSLSGGGSFAFSLFGVVARCIAILLTLVFRFRCVEIESASIRNITNITLIRERYRNH